MTKAKYWKLGDKYAGITARGKHFLVKTLAQAKSKIGASPKSSKTHSKSKKRRTKTAKPKGTSRGGRKIFGNLGFKGLLVGVAGMAIAKIGIRMMLPQLPPEYHDPLALIGVGAVGKVANLPTKNLLPAGIITGGSTLIADLVTPNGLATLPTFGAQKGGYDL